MTTRKQVFITSSSRVMSVSESWFPNIAPHGIFLSRTGTANLARTERESQELPWPFSWSPVNRTKSGFSASKTEATKSLVKSSPHWQGTRSVSRHWPWDVETSDFKSLARVSSTRFNLQCKSATWRILYVPLWLKCNGGARAITGGVEMRVKKERTDN